MSFLAFLSYAVLAIFTPGPNTVMSMSISARYGFRRAFRFASGVFLGFFVVMSLCALGGSFLYARVPGVEPWLRAGGAGYILYLAWKMYRLRPGGDGDDPAKAPGLLGGFLLQCVNVKVLLFGLLMMTTFILPHYRDAVHLAFFVTLLSMLGFVANLCWAGCGAAFARLFDGHGKALNLILALLLAYCAVSLFR